MYILKDENNKIIACAKDYGAICDAKTMLNCTRGTFQRTNEEIIEESGVLYLKSEFEEYKKTDEYKYNSEKMKAEAEILRLKKELQDDDYKIIKTIEAKLLMEEIPYDIEALTNERKLKRNRINELSHQFVF